MSSHELTAEVVEDARASDVSSARSVVWDWPVRAFHWALVAAFIGAYVTHRLGIDYFKYHAWCGYAVIVLVLFRLGWGFVGTHHSRFTSFVRGPVQTLRYARGWLAAGTHHEPGHNPLGAWMVLVLLAVLLAQGVLGLFGNDDILNVGPLYGYVSEEVSATLTSLHRRLFYWIAAAVAVHVIAVVLHVLVKKHDVLRPMIFGQSVAHDRRRPTLSLRTVALLFLASVAVFAIAIFTAPPAALSE